MGLIPSKINMFNVYDRGERCVGISDEVNLPDFESMTETLSGPGILGEIDDPTLGQFGSMEMEIPFVTLTQSMFKLIGNNNVVNATLRGSIQMTNPETGEINNVGMRIAVRGMLKGITGGSVKQGQGTKSSIKIELTYILIEIGSKQVIELDKLNFVYKINGKDLLERIRKLC